MWCQAASDWRPATKDTTMSKKNRKNRNKSRRQSPNRAGLVELPVGAQRAATWDRPLRMHFPGATISLGRLLPSPTVMAHITKMGIGPYLATHAMTEWPLDEIPAGPGDAQVTSCLMVAALDRAIVIVSWLEAGETQIWFADELPSEYLMALCGRAA